MPQVKVRGRGITAEDTAAAIRDALGNGVKVTTEGDREVEVRRSSFVRARVSIGEESGGTVFTVHGRGPAIPLLFFSMTAVNNLGIARQVATALEQHASFRDEGR